MIKKIAIIIVDYNGLQDSIDCIESIKKTNCEESFQIIFIDNASAQNEAEKVKYKYPSIIAIRSEVNKGFSAGNNIGIEYALKAGFDYIVLLNNDTVIDSKMMKKLREQCSEDTVVVPKMFYYSEPQKIWYAGGEINQWTGNAKNSNMGEVNSDEEGQRYCSFATGCCMMIPASVFKRTGLLNEDYFMYCEDTDFSLQLKKHGIKIKYVPAAKLWHKVSASTGSSDSAFCIYYLTRNRFLLCKKWKKEFRWTAYPFSLLTRYIRMLQCKDMTKRKAYRDAIKDAHDGKIGRAEGY